MTELTDRQHQVLILLAEGLTYRQIGKRLKILRNTVSIHAYSMRRALGAQTNAHAVEIGRKRRLLPGIVVVAR